MYGTVALHSSTPSELQSPGVIRTYIHPLEGGIPHYQLIMIHFHIRAKLRAVIYVYVYTCRDKLEIEELINLMKGRREVKRGDLYQVAVIGT